MAVMYPLRTLKDTLHYFWLQFGVMKPNQNNLAIKLTNCISGRDEVIELLIKHGSNVSATDDYGNTALHLAALWGIELKQSCN